MITPDDDKPAHGQSERRSKFSGVDTILNFNGTNFEGTDGILSETNESTSYKGLDRDRFRTLKGFKARRQDIRAKVSFQQKQIIFSRLEFPAYRALMEQHGVDMAETLLYDTHTYTLIYVQPCPMQAPASPRSPVGVGRR